MEIAPHVEAVRADLEALAAGDEATLAVAERLARALDPSLQLRLLDALGQAALELSDQLPTGRVDVRLAGRDVQLLYVAEEVPTAAAAPADDAGSARLTLRMPDSMKSRVEDAAAREGLSTNAWLVRAVTRGLEQRKRPGNRLTGFAQS